MLILRRKRGALRRSNRGNSSSLLVSSNKRARKGLKKITVGGYDEKRSLGEESNDLLTQCFAAMQPSIWYAILPNEERNDDICSGSGQSWERLLPLLLNTKLLTSKVLDSSITYEVNRYGWESFCLTFPGWKLHFSFYRRL